MQRQTIWWSISTPFFLAVYQRHRDKEQLMVRHKDRENTQEKTFSPELRHLGLMVITFALTVVSAVLCIAARGYK
jgi:hypothetical protein